MAEKRRDEMEDAGKQMREGVKHLESHHKEDRREIDRGEHRKRGHEDHERKEKR